MPNGIATVADLCDYQGTNLSKLSAQDQRGMQIAIDGCAGYVQKTTGRVFAPEPALVAGVDSASPVTKTFSARGQRRIRIPDLRTPTSVVLDGLTLDASTGYDIGPLGPDGEPSTYITFSLISPLVAVRPLWTSQLTITGRWGFNPTPPEVFEAVLYMAARKWKRRDNAYADTVATPDGGVFQYFNSLPSDIKEAVLGYRPMKATFAGTGLGV